jgi:hypothetical protein
MRKAKKLLFAALLSLLGLAWPQTARAQFIGDVGLQTVNSILANSATCTGTTQSFVVSNVGQISHQASAFSTAASFTMEIDGFDGLQSYRISNPQISFNNGLATSYIVQASGYYAKVSVVVTCTASATFTLSYAGAQTAFSTIIGPPGGSTVNPSSGIAAQVQGIVTQQQSAGFVDPVITGALQLPINTAFLTTGIDNFNNGNINLPAGTGGTFTVDTVPTPSATGELGIAFESNLSDSSTTSIASPWACAPAFTGGCGSGSPQLSIAFLANVTAGQKFQRIFTSSTPAGQDIASIVLFSGPSATLRQANVASGTGVVAFLGNTLANSALVAAVSCSGTTPCTVSSVADTQGHNWVQVNTLTFNNGQQESGLVVWAATTLSTAAADTITFTMGSGTAKGAEAAEIAGVSTSTPVAPSISNQSNTIGSEIVTLDAQFPNQFVCNVTLSTATTTLCQSAPTTINNVPVRAYVTDFQINTTTQGAGSTLQLKTGTGSNCGTGTANLSAILYSGAAVALQNAFGIRTPLFTPLQTEICVAQVGATPSTTTVEVHGYFAP